MGANHILFWYATICIRGTIWIRLLCSSMIIHFYLINLIALKLLISISPLLLQECKIENFQRIIHSVRYILTGYFPKLNCSLFTRFTCWNSLGYHLDECWLVALMLVAFLNIRNLVVLTHFKCLKSQIYKWVCVTYVSVKLHLVKCTYQSIIQVISLTVKCIGNKTRFKYLTIMMATLTMSHLA